MLKLIVWLNLNETLGLRGKLAVACIGLFMIAAISSQFSGYFGMRADSRMTGWFIPEADRPLTHLSDRGRVESLLRGTQLTPSRKRFLSRNAVWRRQFISRRAPSRFPAGLRWPMSSSTALDARYPATICGVVFQGEYRRHKCQFSFACDGLSDQAQNRRLWQRAMRMAGNKLIDFRRTVYRARNALPR